MKTLLILLGLLLALLLPTHGHDTSVLVFRFQELGDERYQLDYVAPPGSPQGEAPPVLPAHATWEQEPQLPAGPVRLIFATDGKPLSGEDRIVLPWRCSGVLVHAFWRSGETARRFIPRGDEGIVLTIGELRAGVGGTGEAAKRYTLLGVEHMLTGWDHLLFVAGLLLLVKGWRQVVATITTFTLAHSLTLGLSTLGWVKFESGVVEVLIAFSIAVLAVEIIHVSRGQAGITARKPWLVSFLFGLIHGLGFAGVMEDLGLPRQDLPVALLFFNLGVELGQLAMIGLWFAIVKALRAMKLALPLRFAWAPGYALGIIAMVWCLDRAVGLFS
ncbi:HupE/UreJ family protein [Luteolibacter arcticus]|uniref:HupE/UreJ family protein n=1 Tax=Luteolibacter arcticus TaxID=1581411 RepID=A0ABT3GNL2_9BACT|nr:HupE/UreJ family protein [Luteolibacter arcticus]MCW1925083.1 HupE/UreJ family protein [Luteolibacter arcticus]